MGFLNFKLILSIIFAVTCVLVGCTEQDYSPKPKAFYRIKFPEKSYTKIPQGCPFLFEMPVYSSYVDDNSDEALPCWKNIDFPDFNARLHLSYFRINSKANLSTLTEDARALVFKHTTKASSIEESLIHQPKAKIYGIEYTIGGNTASNYQFYVTDSANHYLRGALYFNEKPNIDSIQPVLTFIKDDIIHLLNTLEWK